MRRFVPPSLVFLMAHILFVGGAIAIVALH
jgi:hypothetical protein